VRGRAKDIESSSEAAGEEVEEGGEGVYKEVEDV